jgi:hypothetical protein
MAKFVLVSDSTLNYDYRNFPLLDFMPCAPSNVLPEMVYSFLRGSPSPALPDGRAKYAPYSIRKLEAALLLKFPRKDVVVAHEDHLQNFVDDDTSVIGVSTMDPLGAGPLTMSYSILFESNSYAWVKKEWHSTNETNSDTADSNGPNVEVETEDRKMLPTLEFEFEERTTAGEQQAAAAETDEKDFQIV